MRPPWRRSSRLPAQSTIDARYAAPSSASADAVRMAHEQMLSIAQPASGGASGYLGLRSPAQAAEVLAQVDRYLRREESAGRLDSVEGPFTGDSAAAVGTTHMWLSQAAVAADELRQALENAQISSGGLARAVVRS